MDQLFQYGIGMISNYLRKKRLFLSKKEMKAFINSPINRGVIIRQCEAIRRNLNNKEEIKVREKYLRQYHLIQPKTVNECTQLIEDIQKVVF